MTTGDKVKTDRSVTSFGVPRKKQVHRSRRPDEPGAKARGVPHSAKGTYHVPPGLLILIRDRKIIQVELAAMIGLTQGAVNRKLLGRVSWTYDDLCCLAEKLQVPLAWLI